MFSSLCYSTNYRDDLGKMRPKADIGIFFGYSELSRGFCIYNRQMRKIMETIHVKFNELIAIASECNNSRPSNNCSNFQDSSEELNETPSKEDLDNLFGPLYEEYYLMRTPEVSDNSAANTVDNEDTLSSSSIIVEDHDCDISYFQGHKEPGEIDRNMDECLRLREIHGCGHADRLADNHRIYFASSLALMASKSSSVYVELQLELELIFAFLRQLILFSILLAKSHPNELVWQSSASSTFASYASARLASSC
ncbi:hypothetical protein Tco_0520629 [Tanacetum coccineum]